MKVVFLSDDFPPFSFGGAGISTYELALGVKRAGHEVSIITTCREKSDAGGFDYHGLKIFRIASSYPERWRAYRSLYNPPVPSHLKRILDKIRPDVVHVNNVHYYISYHSIKMAKKYSRIVVITLRDAMSFSFGKMETEKYLKKFDAKLTWLDQFKQAKKRWNPLRNLIIRYYLGYTDKRLAVSSALKNALLQNGIKNVEVMHTGIDLSDYKSFTHGINTKTVFFGGRLSRAKGVQVVEEVMKEILKELPETKLLTAGTGDRWFSREEMKTAYSASNVVLVPSICFDAFPRTVLEAMASSKPVVATCYGGSKEAVVDGETGFVVNPFNIKEMAEKIIDLLKDPKKAEKFGQAGKNRIKTSFNLDDKIKELVFIYERLL